MAIRVYNTLSKTKETFNPVVAGKVGIYLCGPTVYKPSHIGHMVGPVIFDAVKRYLTYSGYQVTLVINITDVDDKLINESKVRGITMAALAEEMTADYMRNLEAMGVDTIDHFPRATRHMDDIIALTKTLIQKGYAYESEGDVYFDVAKDAEYGKLSHRDVTSMQGEGGETVERKRSPADFALWKNAKPGEPSWDSPWGKGRPGWHIECSAMSRKLLGETFDIHGGGLDLMFPHHENEIAQSECCHGKPQANYWMHNGLMQSSGEVGKVGGRNTRAAAEGDQQAQEAGKIGKSKGASPFRDLLGRHAPERIRFFLLSTHYRRPIDFSDQRIDEVGTGLDQLYRFFTRYQRVTGQSFYDIKPPARRKEGDFSPGGDAVLEQIAAHRQHFLEMMDDDFNTGGAVADLFGTVGTLNKFIDEAKLEATKPSEKQLAVLRQGASTLGELSRTLGLFRHPIEEAAADDDGITDQLMKLIIELRADARGRKDFATADKIRNGLSAVKIVLEDRPGGTEWRRN
ncbi:MAG TPA: cysteine--tRNA ligase [Pirellulales bacterium]|nr:cysteine--tRNA ligase [Pirellulales bacterium]